MKLSPFDHIEGLEDSVPVGCKVSVGRKSPGGEPYETDRFYILRKDAEQREFAKKAGGTYKAPQADQHPAFAAWNAVAERDAKAASTIYGYVAFPTQAESWNHNLDAPELRQIGDSKTPPGGGTYEAPPRGRAACRGDGKRAQRFAGLDAQQNPTYLDIPCPNQLCPFRQERGGSIDCRPFGRLYFMLRWPNNEGMPRLLTKLINRSWESCSNINGFFRYVDTFAREAGITKPNLMGLPFVLTVTKKVSAAKKRRYPVLSMSPDGDLVEFFGRQVARLQLAAGTVPRALLGGALSAEENTAEAIALDYESIVPGPGLPAHVAEPAPAELTQAETRTESPEPAVAVRNAKEEAKALGADLLKLVPTKDDAGDILAELLADDAGKGPRTVAGLTLEQIDTARRKLPEHPMARGLFD